MSIKRLEALELAEVLGSLLGSVIDAQAQSARATVAFIEDVGFESTTDGAKLRTVKLRYSKKDEDGQPAAFMVEVPLLAMVNVPSLSVREAKLSFSYDVVVAASTNSPSNSTAPGALGPGSPALQLAKKPALIKGFVRAKLKSDKDGSMKKTTSIDLDVTLEQQEVPIGVERLFDLAELGILESKVEE